MLGVSALWVNGLPFACWLAGAETPSTRRVGKGKGRY